MTLLPFRAPDPGAQADRHAREVAGLRAENARLRRELAEVRGSQAHGVARALFFFAQGILYGSGHPAAAFGLALGALAAGVVGAAIGAWRGSR